jgi:hypothetical protein
LVRNGLSAPQPADSLACMPAGPRQRSWWKPALTVAYSVVGLVFLIDGITSRDWLKVGGGALLLLGLVGQLWEQFHPRPPASDLPVDHARAEVVALATSEDPIKAVKLLRQRTGLGLRDATATVRRWLDEEGIPWR